jgi:sortase A
MFTDLELMEAGDVFYLHVLGEVLAYQVYSKEAVLPHDTTRLGIIQGEDICTLITCYPTGINTHRLLVQGERIPYEKAEEIQEVILREEEPESNWEDQYMLGIYLGMIVMAIAGLVFLLWRLYRSRRSKKGGRYVRKREVQKEK